MMKKLINIHSFALRNAHTCMSGGASGAFTPPTHIFAATNDLTADGSSYSMCSA
jgi:hypothetical protein